jgi:transcriptional regulator NrdR family protein
MARHDIQCENCELVISNIVIEGSKIGKGGVIKKKCPECGKMKFHTYWGSGETPNGFVNPANNEEKFDRSKTFGEFWDRTGVNPQSPEYHKASKRRIEGMRQKAMKKRDKQK